MKLSTVKVAIIVGVFYVTFTIFLYFTSLRTTSSSSPSSGNLDVLPRDGFEEKKFEEYRVLMNEMKSLGRKMENVEKKVDDLSFVSKIEGKIDDHEEEPVVQKTDKEPDLHTHEMQIPIVIFTYNRGDYLERTLNSILKYLPDYDKHKFPIFISQDGYDKSVESVVQKYFPYIERHVHKEHENTQFEDPLMGAKSYYYIAAHYKYGINEVFQHDVTYDRVIILEEDIEVAPDFFEYFSHHSPLFDEDDSLMCISAFNDNGMRGKVLDPVRMYRSDFFPGLGWMMSRNVWMELKSKWPLGFWDDWLRLPENRKGRACLRPEISRTYTFGVKGTSKGQFSKYLKEIQLNNVPIIWNKVDSEYLKKENYDSVISSQLENAMEVNVNNVEQQNHRGVDLKIKYGSKKEMRNLQKHFKIMDDEKSGVPRGAYKGIVTFVHYGNHVYLYPSRQNLLYKHD